MGGEVEVFYDDTPGERRGMVARDGRFHSLLIEREGDPAETRLGARVVGRVRAVEPALRGAFVDLGVAGPPAFLPLGKAEKVLVGEALELTVTAEAREAKGPVVRRTGSGQGPSPGEPRLIAPAPDLLDQLRAEAKRLGAPDAGVRTGAAAIQAAWDAEEEAMSSGDVFPDFGLDLAVQRTRALISVDIDFAPRPGRDGRKGRVGANREGLRQAARLIGLKRWGGLVVVDLVGGATDGNTVAGWAREAFSAWPETAVAPVSRFGLLQLSLPWRLRPAEEVLAAGDIRVEAVRLCRRLRHALLSDTASPRIVASARPELAGAAAPLIGRLGPRAGLRPDPAVRPGRETLTEV